MRAAHDQPQRESSEQQRAESGAHTEAASETTPASLPNSARTFSTPRLPPSPATLMRLQQAKGNAFVSRQLAQRAPAVPIIQRAEEHKEPLAAVQGLAMYDLLPKLAALPPEVRTDEDAGRAVSGPRLVIAMRAVRAKSDKDLVGFLSINKPELDKLPADQVTQIMAYLGAPGGSASPRASSTSEIPIAQLSTTEKLTRTIQRAVERKLLGALGDRVNELLQPESIALMVSFTAIYIASQATPAGWVADGVAIALLLASAVMIGPEVVTIVEHFVSFVQKATNATSDAEIDSAAEDLAFAVTKLGVDVLMAILMHKAGKAGGNAVKAYVKPAPAFVDALTPDGRIIRVPAEEATSYESRGSGRGGGKTSTVDAIRALGDDFIDQSEGRGDAHLIREHVARTNQELVRRANQEQVDSTTFENKSSAIAAVRYNLRVNAAKVAAWLEDPNVIDRLTIEADHPMSIGRGVKQGSRTVTYDLGTSRLVLVKDAGMPLKFRIQTGFPVLQP